MRKDRCNEWRNESAICNAVAVMHLPLSWSCLVISASVMFLNFKSILHYKSSSVLPTEVDWFTVALVLGTARVKQWIDHISFVFTCTAIPQSHTGPLNQHWFIKKSSTESQWSGPNLLKAGSWDNLPHSWQNQGITFPTLSGHQEEVQSEKALNCLTANCFFI